MKSRYVYLMESSRTGEYKIGVSKNPDVRKKALETGHGAPLIICKTFYTAFPFAVEARLHQYFEHQRGSGEFFELKPHEVERFSYLCELYHTCSIKEMEELDW
jgi:hypothetical protein